jgi:hypothetical protein
MELQSKKQNIYYALRFASALCFIGHGSFGIITKAIWCNYFAVFGIGHDLAYHLMPILGTIDILMGISLLIYPTRAILGWLIVWGFVTALCRPLSGEPVAEFIERAGNFGTPLALLILCGFSNKDLKGWFTKVTSDYFSDKTVLRNVTIFLRIIVFLLLIGHGCLNMIEKKGLLTQYASLGFSNPANVAHIVGAFEMLAGLSVLIKPVRPVLFVFLVWKMGSELFYPHWELFEWIERAGSYGAILALLLALPRFPITVTKRYSPSKA